MDHRTGHLTLYKTGKIMRHSERTMIQKCGTVMDILTINEQQS